MLTFHYYYLIKKSRFYCLALLSYEWMNVKPYTITSKIIWLEIIYANFSSQYFLIVIHNIWYLFYSKFPNLPTVTLSPTMLSSAFILETNFIKVINYYFEFNLATGTPLYLGCNFNRGRDTITPKKLFHHRYLGNGLTPNVQETA